MSRLIINSEIAKATANLSTIPAYIDATGAVTYWDNLTKEIAHQFWLYGMHLNVNYSLDQVGSMVGSEVLGCLEDNYPDWVAEFEESI